LKYSKKATKAVHHAFAFCYQQWIWSVDYVVRKFKENKARKQQEQPQDRYSRRTAHSTIAMAGFTGILIVVNWIQLREIQNSGAESSGQTNQMLNEYRQQVAQLKRQAEDTHNLAVATGTQADRTKDLADRMKDQSDQTKIIANQAVVQANANRRLAQNAADTLLNTQASFRDEQRAWIGVAGIADAKGFTETDPWQVTVIFFNSGRTPARNAQISGLYITSPIPLTGPPQDLTKSLIFGPIQSIAPQGYYRETIGIEFAGEITTDFQRTGSQVLVSQYSRIKSKQLFLYYYGVLKYDDAFGKPHQTQYCIFLANPNTKEAGICDAFNDLD
jgi:hypothetical protein